MKQLLISLLVLCMSLHSIAESHHINIEINQKADAYTMMESVFVGKHKKDKIKALLEPVMKKHNLTVTETNLLKCASALVTLRKSSAVGVTEMEILKHMYQKGSSKLNFPNQAAISASHLELTK